MEFVLTTDIQKELPQVIEFNFEELEIELSKQLEKYNNTVITPQEIPASKTDRANLNKLKCALEDNRKSIKSMYLVPYEAFAKKIKRLTDLIDEPIQNIDRQLKEYDKVRKDEKKEQITKLHNETMGDWKDLILLEKIWNPKWLNVGYQIPDIEADMEAARTKVEDGIQMIEELNSEFCQQMKDKFFDTLDISKAFAENKKLMDLKLRQEQYQRAKEETEKKLILNTSKKSVPEVEQEQCKTVFTVDFRVDATEEQLTKLKEFLVVNHMKYGRVPTCQVTA